MDSTSFQAASRLNPPHPSPPSVPLEVERLILLLDYLLQFCKYSSSFVSKCVFHRCHGNKANLNLLEQLELERIRFLFENSPINCEGEFSVVLDRDDLSYSFQNAAIADQRSDEPARGID